MNEQQLLLLHFVIAANLIFRSTNVLGYSIPALGETDDRDLIRTTKDDGIAACGRQCVFDQSRGCPSCRKLQQNSYRVKTRKSRPGDRIKRSSVMVPSISARVEHLLFSNISIVVRQSSYNDSSILEASISWKTSAKDVTREDLDKRGREVMVVLAKSCLEEDDHLPQCAASNQLQTRTVRISYNQMSSCTFSGLVYGVNYWTAIKYNSMETEKIHFPTPICTTKLNSDYKKCELTTATSTTPNQSETFTIPDNRHVIQLVCAQLNNPKEKVNVLLKWPQLHNGSESVVSTILIQNYQKTDPDIQFQMEKTTNYSYMVELKLDRVYEILIKTTNQTHESVFDSLVINTSLASVRRHPQCRNNDRAEPIVGEAATTTADGSRIETDRSQSIIIAVLSLGFVAFLAFLLAFGLKRCQKLRQVLVIKRMISKTNSYRSSPSGSVQRLEDRILQRNDNWEINTRELSLGLEIGHGAFGSVFMGYYRKEKVAIKMLRESVPESYKDDLLRELATMKSIGRHSHIVTILGACTLTDPVALVMEYMPYGNLQLFLKKCRTEGEFHHTDEGRELLYCLLDELTGFKERWNITSFDMISFARQIAVAMEHLSSKRFVHRDLAARNVLVTYNKVVKLGDFGLARSVDEDYQYFKLTNGRLPLKWMAPESIRDRVFTIKSDVWSYGVLLWEIVTMGCSPYPNVALVDVYRLLVDGYRMEKPRNCSEELYAIMLRCWGKMPTDRPTFTDIKYEMESLLSTGRNYLDLDEVLAKADHSSSMSDNSSELLNVKLLYNSDDDDDDFAGNIEADSLPVFL